MNKIDWITASRNLKNDYRGTLIKIIGLVLGFGVLCVALLFLVNELNFNKSVKHKANLYRVLNTDTDTHMKWANTPLVLGKTILESSPDVTAVLSYRIVDDFELKVNDEYLSEKRLLATSSSVFDMMSINVLAGDVKDMDHDETQLALSESMAIKYFGTSNAVGQPIMLRSNGEEFSMSVAAVYANIPYNSTLNEKFIVHTNVGLKLLMKSMASIGETIDMTKLKEGWRFGLFFTTIIKTSPKASVVSIKEQLNIIAQENTTENNALQFSLQPYADIYFKSDKDLHDNNNAEAANRILIITCLSVGLLSLLVAIINYITIEFSKTNKQLRTFGVRKVFGGSKISVANSYAIENLLVFLFSFALALLLAWLLMPTLSTVLGKNYALSFAANPSVLFTAMLLIVILALTIGYLILPGRLNSFTLSDSLLGGKSKKVSAFNASSLLVIVQIIVFMVCVAGAIIIKKQVDFALNRDLGFEKEGVICVWKEDKDYQLLKTALLTNPAIKNVSAGFALPPYQGGMNISLKSDKNPDERVSLGGIFVDYNFVETLNLTLLEGEVFTTGGVSEGVIITESAKEAMGYAEPLLQDMGFGPVVGVIKNFSEHSIHSKARPVVLILNPDGINEIAIKVNTADLSETIAFIEQEWNNIPGNAAFEYKFVDDKLEEMYEGMLSLNTIINWCAFITIFIACLGLYGLSIFVSQQRIKEIGVRKVNGARVFEIMKMLNKDFVLWVVIAFVFAAPIAYWIMNKWLQNFAYQTILSWWVFALAGCSALAISLLTVSWQTFKAARRNPIEALRYE